VIGSLGLLLMLLFLKSLWWC